MKNIRLIAFYILTQFLASKIYADNLKFSDNKKTDSLKLSQFFLEKCYANLFLEINDDFKINGGGRLTYSAKNINSENSFFLKDKNQIFGLSFSTKDLFKYNSFTVKTGNLNYSGGISKLHNPQISNSTAPFSNPTCAISNIKATIPTISSSNQSFSTAIFTDYENPTAFIPSIKFSSFLIPDDKFSIDISISKKIKKTSFEFNSINEIFSSPENIPSSWFSKECNNLKDYYFHKDSFFSSLNQISGKLNNFSSLFSLGLYESPFKFCNFIIKSENKYKIGKINLNFSVYLNKNEIFTLTGSNKKLEDCLQMKGGCNFQFILKKHLPYFFKSGTTFYYKSAFLPYSNPSEFKYSLGEQIISPFQRFSFIFTNQILYVDDKISSNGFNFQLKNNWFLEKINPGAEINFTVTKKGNNYTTEETVKISGEFLKNPKVYFTTNFSVYQKDFQFEKMDLGCSITAKYFFNKNSVQVKIKNLNL